MSARSARTARTPPLFQRLRREGPRRDGGQTTPGRQRGSWRGSGARGGGMSKPWVGLDRRVLSRFITIRVTAQVVAYPG